MNDLHSPLIRIYDNNSKSTKRDWKFHYSKNSKLVSDVCSGGAIWWMLAR